MDIIMGPWRGSRRRLRSPICYQRGVLIAREGSLKVQVIKVLGQLTTARVRRWKASALAGLRPKLYIQVSRGDIVSSGKERLLILKTWVSVGCRRGLCGQWNDVLRQPPRSLTGQRESDQEAKAREQQSVFLLQLSATFQDAGALPRVDVEEAWGKARPATARRPTWARVAC
jgi:hypothetical protein